MALDTFPSLRLALAEHRERTEKIHLMALLNSLSQPCVTQIPIGGQVTKL